MLSHAEVNGSSGSNRLIVLAKAMFFKGSNDQPCRREFRELTRYDKSKLYCEARDEIVKFGMWNVDRRQSVPGERGTTFCLFFPLTSLSSDLSMITIGHKQMHPWLSTGYQYIQPLYSYALRTPPKPSLTSAPVKRKSGYGK
jgi:hypothetical protein